MLITSVFPHLYILSRNKMNVSSAVSVYHRCVGHYINQKDTSASSHEANHSIRQIVFQGGNVRLAGSFINLFSLVMLMLIKGMM